MVTQYYRHKGNNLDYLVPDVDVIRREAFLGALLLLPILLDSNLPRC